MRSSSSRRWPSPAFLVAIAALMVTFGGAAYAASKLPKNSVGTKQIKNNAVTGAKVKAGSLGSGDFASGALRGPQGPQGPAGASVTTPALAVFRDGRQTITSSNPTAPTVIATMNGLSEGAWAINAKTVVYTDASNPVKCQLLAPAAGGGDVDTSGSAVDFLKATIALQLLHEVPAGSTQSVRVACWKTTNASADASSTKIQAVRLTSATNTAVGG